MAVNYVKGQILSSNLERDGIDLAISNANVGIGTLTPTARLEVVGNIAAGTVLIANIGTVSAASNITGGNLLTVGMVSAASNITGGNLLTVGIVSAASNITGGNLLTVGVVSAMGTVTGGNVLTGGVVSAAGNTTGGNLLTAGTVSAAGNAYANTFVGNTAIIGTVSATATILTGNIVIPATGNISAGNININNLQDPVAPQDAATKNYVDAAIANVTNQTLNGDGTTVTFTLIRSTTTAAALIMLNGITQVPNQAYAMLPSPSTNLVFTEAPAPSDVIDIRFL
jgi:hypothetical protein